MPDIQLLGSSSLTPFDDTDELLRVIPSDSDEVEASELNRAQALECRLRISANNFETSPNPVDIGFGLSCYQDLKHIATSPNPRYGIRFDLSGAYVPLHQTINYLNEADPRYVDQYTAGGQHRLSLSTAFEVGSERTRLILGPRFTVNLEEGENRLIRNRYAIQDINSDDKNNYKPGDKISSDFVRVSSIEASEWYLSPKAIKLDLLVGLRTAITKDFYLFFGMHVPSFDQELAIEYRF